MRTNNESVPSSPPRKQNQADALHRRLRVGVVGCRIGHRHALAYARLKELFDLQAVCDIDSNRACAVSESLHGVRWVQDFGDLLDGADLDIVSICTPPSLHFAQTRQALEAGCHVICEKPLVGSLHELDVLAEIAERSGTRIIPVFQMRYGGGLQKLRRLVERGVAGRSYLATVETAWHRTREYYEVQWRRTWSGALGGCLLGHAVHAHDMLTCINGPVARVRAFAKTLVNPVETEDCATASLEMADGSLASLSVTLGSVVELSRLRFCFENLVAESNASPYDCASDPWSFVGANAEVDGRIAEVLRDWTPGPEGYDAQFLDAHRLITEGRAGAAGLPDARTAIELASALYHAAMNDETVSLPLSVDHPAYGGFHPRVGQPFGRGSD